MANIKSTEKLKAMFQQSKERKEKERQQQRFEKQKQYQELCKEADRLLKEAIRDEKKKKMEQLSALIQKTSQKRNKQPYIDIDNSRWIDADKHVYHLTREELEELEPNAINWEKWDEIVNQTREQFKDMDFDMRKQHRDGFKYKGGGIHIYAYTLENNLIGHYQSSLEAAAALHIPVGTVSTTLYGCGVCKKHKIKLYKHPLYGTNKN